MQFYSRNFGRWNITVWRPREIF